ncbi:MAG: 50S ribosomal protein L6 [Candidatus Margulisiibacteriota bacterium]
MSRIGRAPIQIPAGVTVSADGAVISVKGPKGVLMQQIDPSIEVKIEGSVINLSRKSEIKKHKAMHGLYRSLLANMIKGVHTGFEKNLEINGVGYRVAKEGKKLVLSMGYSHPVSIEPPAGIDFVVEGQTKVKVVGIDKQLVGQIAADIKYVRPVEPYKGKGIRYAGQDVRRKAGKAAAKAAS